MPIPVRALKPGFDGITRRKEGEEFQIDDEAAFSDRWMERMTPKEVKASAQKKEEFDKKLDDKLSGPDVKDSLRKKYEDDFKTDLSGKDQEEKLQEGAEKADDKAKAEADKSDKADKGRLADDRSKSGRR